MMNLRPLSFGEILDGAFAMYRRAFFRLYLTALLPYVPLVAISVLVLPVLLLGGSESLELFVNLTLALGVLMVGATPFIWGALTHVISAELRGNTSGWREGYRSALQRWRGLVGSTVLAMLAIAASSFAVMVPAVIVGGALSVMGSAALGPVGGALVLLVVLPLVFAPAFFLTAGWMVMVPVVMDEDAGPVGALRRSWELMRGARWRGLGLWLVGTLIVAIPSGLVAAMLYGSALGGAITLTPSAGDDTMLALSAVNQAINPLVASLTVPFTTGLFVLLYFDRRVRAEGLDLELIEEEIDNLPPEPA